MYKTISFEQYKQYNNKENFIFAFYPEKDNQPKILNYLDTFQNNTGREIVCVSFKDGEAHKPCAYFEVNIGEQDFEIYTPVLDLNEYINRKMKTLTKNQDVQEDNNIIFDSYKDVN